MKRLIKMIGALIIAITIFAGFVEKPVMANKTSEDYYTAKANYIKNSEAYEILMNMDLPYRDFANKLDSNVTFKASYVAWKLAMFEFDDLVEDVTGTSQYMYYEAMLIDILTYGISLESNIDLISDAYKSLHLSTWKKFNKLDKEKLNELLKTAKELKAKGEDTTETISNIEALLDDCDAYNKAFDILVGSETIIGLGDIIEYTSDAADLAEIIVKAIVINELSIEYSYVLDDMASRTSDIYLSAALNRMSDTISETSEEFLAYSYSAEWGMEKIWEKTWGEVKKKLVKQMGVTGVSIELAQSAGKAVSNILFATEDNFTCYFEMCALRDIESLMKETLMASSGVKFCSGFNLYKNAVMLGLDYTDDYMRIIYNDGIINKFFAWARNQRYEEHKEKVEELKFLVDFSFFNLDLFFESEYNETNNGEVLNDIYPDYVSPGITENEVEEQWNDVEYELYNVSGSNFGKNITLKEDMIVNGDFYIPSGNIDLNGFTLTIYGNLLQEGGRIYVNDGTLNVVENYHIQSETTDENGNTMYESCDGVLRMDSNDSKINIKGNFITRSSKPCDGGKLDANWFGGGVLTVNGDFYQYVGMTYVKNFTAFISHKVVLNGTGKQTVYFEDPDCFFNTVEVANEEVMLAGKINIYNLLNDLHIKSDNLIIKCLNNNGNDVGVDGDVYIEGPINMSGGNLTINGNVGHNAGKVIISNCETIVNGDYNISGGTLKLPSNTLNIKGNINQFGGSVGVTGGILYVNNIKQSGGNLYVANTGTINVNGNYYIQSETTDENGNIIYGSCNGSMRMHNENSKINIKGNFITRSSKPCDGGKLDANWFGGGVLTVNGDFYQYVGMTYVKNFTAFISHKVVLNGTGKQTVYFEDPGCFFNTLEIQNPNVEFNRTPCWTKLISRYKESGKEFKIDIASVVLSSDISLRYYVLAEQLVGAQEVYMNADFCGVSYKLYPDKETTMMNGAEYYSFTFQNVAPNRMNDDMVVSIYADYGDVEYLGKDVIYGIHTYCYNMLNKSTTPDTLKTLIVDLLNYGAASQIYTGYETENLVNTALTDGQKALGTAGTPDMENSTHIGKELNEIEATWKIASLYLHSSIAMKFYFVSENNVDDLYVKVNMSDETYIINSGQIEKVDINGTNYYCITFDSISADQMKNNVILQVFDLEGNPISNTLTYSIESYAYSKQNDSNVNLASLVISVMKYINSVNVYANA